MNMFRPKLTNVRFKGGGGSSGAVSYPAYMELWHTRVLDKSGTDVIVHSMTDIMNSAIGFSPWTGAAAYDPDIPIATMLASVGDLQTMVDLLSSGTTLDTLIAGILDESRVDDVVAEYAADFDARLTAEILPRFERGMQDINAVVSSAFVIGKAIIEENQDRQVAKFSADLHNKFAGDDALKIVALKLEYQKAASHMISEANRIKIVAKNEELEVNTKIDEEDALWDLEVFQYGANLLAGIGSGTARPLSKQPSKAQSAIGGAMSGAAAGAMFGPYGAIFGAVLGAASSMA